MTDIPGTLSEEETVRFQQLRSQARGTGRRAAAAKRQMNAMVSVEGVPVSAATSSPNAFTAAQLEEIAEADRRDEELRRQAALRVRQVQEAKKGSSRRGGALKPDLYGNNKAVIEVLKFDGKPLRGSMGNLVGSFDQLVITQVQEQDAEKINIQETFGAPHLFASGRFMRKYVFAGVARAAAVNYKSLDSGLRTPQAVQMRYCYDHHLRASLQAERGHYTRVVVDEDAYEGWITTYNQTRDSQNENWINFVFSLVAYDRYHVHLEGDAFTLFSRWDQTTRETGEDGVKQPSAELSDALGKANVRVSKEPTGGLVKELDLGRVEIPPDEADSPRGLTFYVGVEDDDGSGSTTQQVLAAVSSMPGLEVVSDGAPLTGMKTAESGSRLLASIKITDYRRFVLEASETDDGVPIKITVAPGAGEAATVTARIVTTGEQTPKITLVSASLQRAGEAPVPLTAGAELTSRDRGPHALGDAQGWTSSIDVGVILPGNIVTLNATISVLVGGRPAPESLLTSMRLANGGRTKVTPVISDRVAAERDDRVSITLIGVSVSGPTNINAAKGEATFQLTTTIASSAFDLTQSVNPTTATSAILAQWGLLFRGDGVADVDLRPVEARIKLRNPAPTNVDLWNTPSMSVSSAADGTATIKYVARAKGDPHDVVFGRDKWEGYKTAVLKNALFQVVLWEEISGPTPSVTPRVQSSMRMEEGEVLRPRVSAALTMTKVVFEPDRVEVEIRAIPVVDMFSSKRVWVADFRPTWTPIQGTFTPPPVAQPGQPFLALTVQPR